MSLSINEIETLDDCDYVTADDMEAWRRELGPTPSEFAEQLGWSTRKYQRVLEAAREDGAAQRDVVLSLIGLSKLFNAPGSSGGIRSKTPKGKRFLPDDIYLGLIEEICGEQRAQGHEWTAQVTPHVLNEVALCAGQGMRVTYDDLATRLEAKGATHRVWPRTAYGRPLGSVCTIVTTLGQRSNKRIPLLSAIVVKQDGSPGEGFDGMTKDFFKVHEAARYRELRSRMRSEREALVAELQREVLQFPHWEEVARALGLRS
ncbi:MAG: hypothetical protein QOG66_944 [Methylobacteriaceae bacterium]|jgi:hypothetical protein|nr:hypothetical protein [Methylobacteriaceae bacterium]